MAVVVICLTSAGCGGSQHAPAASVATVVRTFNEQGIKLEPIRDLPTGCMPGVCGCPKGDLCGSASITLPTGRVKGHLPRPIATFVPVRAPKGVWAVVYVYRSRAAAVAVQKVNGRGPASLPSFQRDNVLLQLWTPASARAWAKRVRAAVSQL